MKDFYINVIQRGNNLLIREFKDGKKVKRKVRYKPTLYVPVQKKTDYKSLSGHSLAPISFDSIHEAKQFMEKYEDQKDLVFGMERFAFSWLAENHPGIVNWDFSQLNVLSLDIEVASENGFPDPTVAEEELLSITVKNYTNKQILVWGTRPYEIHNSDVQYVECYNEKDLLKRFLDFWENYGPDIITGWNIKYFDMPYLCNRIDKILGEDEKNRFSPWNIVHSRTTYIGARPQNSYDIFGISTLDYLELYRKYTYTNRESYRLDYIAQVELGQQKHENPYETYKEWYTNDYQSFIDYNIQDVELIDRLEEKMKLIELHLTMAYEGRMNPQDVFSQVRMWDVIIFNFLWERNVITPMKTRSSKGERYEGAYVKEPQVGLHKWIVSFDLNSLYPHLIQQYNISTETLMKDRNPSVNVEALLEKSSHIYFDPNCSTTPNGSMFTNKYKGFMPALMEKFYSERVIFKQKSIEARKKYEETKQTKYLNDISKFNNIQMARKIALNSAYGAIGNEYFRFYSNSMATAITTAGQLSIRWIENKVNEYLNRILQTEDKDYVVASDTDSIYVCLDELVSKSFGERDNIPTDKIVTFLAKVASQKLEPFIDESYGELAEYVNAFDQKMFMKREVIADKAIWIAKKRYILNVHDSEGVRYDEPRIKMMGIEAVKSSTPAPCRDMIKTALKIIINDDEVSLNTFIQSFRKVFMKLSPEEIAYPRSCNGLSKWSDSSGVFKKGTPIHVKGVLMYNHLLKQKNLTHKYPLIQEGEKIKYLELRKPNILQSNSISFIANFPKEFDLNDIIDRDIMFDKSFVEPLNFIVKEIGWQIDRSYGTQLTLESLFG